MGVVSFPIIEVQPEWIVEDEALGSKRKFDLFRSPLARTGGLQPEFIDSTMGKLPEGWMSPLARRFATALTDYTIHELRRLVP
jgi:hypothetical protein